MLCPLLRDPDKGQNHPNEHQQAPPTTPTTTPKTTNKANKHPSPITFLPMGHPYCYNRGITPPDRHPHFQTGKTSMWLGSGARLDMASHPIAPPYPISQYCDSDLHPNSH